MSKGYRIKVPMEITETQPYIPKLRRYFFGVEQ